MFLARFLLILYVVVSPWSAWLAITGWLRLPVVALLAALLALSVAFLIDITKRPLQIIAYKQYYWALGVVFCSLIALFASVQTNPSRSINHFLSIVFFVGFYLILFKWAWRRVGLTVQNLFKYITFALVLADSIVIIEWIFVNVFDFQILRQTFILDQSVTNMVYYQQPFFRSVPGLAEEPSLMAFNLNCLFPLAFYYCKHFASRLFMYGIVLLQLLALVATASAGGIGFFVLSYFVGQISVIGFHRFFVLARIVGIAVVLLVGGYWFLAFEYQAKADLFVNKIQSKFIFEDESAGMRTRAWQKGLEDWAESPWFGRGLAYGNEAYDGFGYQSMYIKLLAETGIFSLMFLLIFFIFIWQKILLLPNNIRPWMAMSISSAMMHLAISDAYYHVCFWIVVCGLQMFFVNKPQSELACVS